MLSLLLARSISVKLIPYLYLSGIVLAGNALAAPASEPATLSLLLTQLDMLDATLKRAQSQSSVAPDDRFFFDYPQAHADIHAIRSGIEQYLTPSRAQPQPILPLVGQYRRESVQ
ncbi:conjugal transfer protein [Salmonella enterica subsp. enterica]|nr:conjugal transfer protein [Salmonella enterica subsp. enterica serovar Langford]EHZ3052606.1 conjugal transfer protein [Salmonella enterica subsp. enterica]